MVEWCASVPREGLMKSERQLLQFLALAQPTGLRIPKWLLTMGHEVLRQAGVSVSREFDFEPALPFTMGTVGSDSDFQDCASPTASASGHMGACFD